MKYALPALALAAALLAPSAALAYCNGAGSSCSYSQSSSYSQPYYAYSQYRNPHMYQQQYQYAPYGGYYGQGYGYQQPLYFPAYNTTFPNLMPQQYGYAQGYYGYGQSYGYYGYGQQYGGYGYGTGGCINQGGYQICY
jgi:hypothetical protein